MRHAQNTAPEAALGFGVVLSMASHVCIVQVAIVRFETEFFHTVAAVVVTLWSRLQYRLVPPKFVHLPVAQLGFEARCAR